MHCFLTSTCLVLVIFQQYNCFINSTSHLAHNNNNVATGAGKQEAGNTGAEQNKTEGRETTTRSSKIKSFNHLNRSVTKRPHSEKTVKETASYHTTDDHKNENQQSQKSETSSIHAINSELKQATANSQANIMTTTYESTNTNDITNITEILTSICGETYIPCSKTPSGIKNFKESSICKPCSCDVQQCHISKNCCPDVETHDTNLEESSTATKPSCINLSDVLSPKLTGDEQEMKIDSITDKTMREYEGEQGTHDNSEVKEQGTLDNSEVDSAKSPKVFTESTLELTTPQLTKDYWDFNNLKNHSIDFNRYKNGEEEIDTHNNSLYEMRSQKEEKGKQRYANKAKNVIKDNKRNKHTLSKSTEDQWQKKGLGILSRKHDSSSLATSFFPKYLVIDTCSPNFYDNEIITKCEESASPLLAENIPVSDWFNLNIYHNKWCANCNNISFTEPWRVVTDCLQLYTMDYLPQMLSDFHKITRNCTVRVITPSKLRTDPQICEDTANDLKITVIDKCNVTGLWKSNLRLTDSLCAQRKFMPNFEDTQSMPKRIYKNIFCFICNTNRSFDTSDGSGQKGYINTDLGHEGSKLYMEIQIEDEKSSSNAWLNNNHTMTCPQGHIPDVYTDDCIQFECPIHQRPLATLCVNRDRAVTGLVLAAKIQLVFHKPVYIGNTENEMTQYGKMVIDIIDKELKISKSGCEIVFVKLFANSTHSSKGYMRKMFLVFKVANTNKCSVETVVHVYTILTDKHLALEPTNSLESHALTSTFHSKQTTKFTTSLSFEPMTRHEINITLVQKPVHYETWLKEKFYCPKVLLTKFRYIKLVKQGLFNWTEALKHTAQPGLLAVCYSSYLQPWLSKMYSTPIEETLEENYSLTNILSLISTIVSMASIILVLVTYSLFSELRYIPGKIFMVLSLNLLLAQGFYCFGLNFNTESIWCRVFGVCIHFFWVATMFSMNSSLWLMLRNFKDPLGSDNLEILQSKSNYPVVKYSSYTYAMSALCVLLNTVLSHFIYHDNKYGYGSELCYINKREMRIVTFALPIALIILINICMFSYIMVTVTKQIVNKFCNAMKIQVSIFLKLSTITGVYWAFGFIYEATQLRIFECLFIILNGGQGFFLMWSFVLNGQTFDLYRNLLRNLFCKKENQLYNKIGRTFGLNNSDKNKSITESSC